MPADRTALASPPPAPHAAAGAVAPKLTLLPASTWQAHATAHATRIDAAVGDHRARAARGEAHPVHDFLFTYYSFRPAWLRRWHPGPDVVLLGAAAEETFLRWPGYRRATAGELADSFSHTPTGEGSGSVTGTTLDLAALPEKRRTFIAWLRDFLRAQQARPAFFGCYGLHEWAMVYRQSPEEIRHARHPLRFPPEELAAIVERGPVCCTHYDAFRFFTPAARPLNRHQPTRETVPQLEQRGCLHAGMDLYKWAYKLAPYSPSDLVADCFDLACAIRTVDMRASPYDLRALGYEPIAIETPTGRAIYEREQRAFATAAEPLRARLLALCDRLLAP